MTPGTFFQGAYNALFEGPSERCHAYGPLGSSSGAERGYAFWKLTAGTTSRGALSVEDDDEEDDESTEDEAGHCSAAATKLMSLMNMAPVSPASAHLPSSQEGNLSEEDDHSSDTGSSSDHQHHLMENLALEVASVASSRAEPGSFIGPQFLLPTVHSTELVHFSAPSTTSSAGSSFEELPAGSTAFARLLEWHSTTGAAESAAPSNDAMMLALVISHLPLKEALECAAVSKAFRRAVRAALPVTKEGFLCLPYVPRTLRASAVASTAAGRVCQMLRAASTNASTTPPPQAPKMRSCQDCRNTTVEAVDGATRCSTCLERNPSGNIVRVFMGQLRKDRTSEFPTYLLNMIFPDMYIPHIESHTGVDNRGKGCAWVHVTTDADAQRLLALDKRLFLDLDENGAEAVLMCDASEDGRAQLRAFADRFGPDPLRPMQLPRQPMVLELPKNGSSPTSGKGRRRPQRPGDMNDSPIRGAAAEFLLAAEVEEGKKVISPPRPERLKHQQKQRILDPIRQPVAAIAGAWNPYAADVLHHNRMYTTFDANGSAVLPHITVGTLATA